MVTDYLVLEEIVNRLRNRNISIKVVIFNDEDLEYARNLHKKFETLPFIIQVGNNDTETIDDEKLIKESLKNLENLIDKIAIDKDFNNVRILPQLHTLIWGNKRGV
jgi:7-carboxy-7-deazaguanine synthase